MKELISEYTRLIYLRKGGDLKIQVSEGKKYYRIVTVLNGNSAAHSFVDKYTGCVYKPKTFVSPCPTSSYNILEEESRQSLFKNCEYSGKYLR